LPTRFSLLGDISYTVYLSHVFVISVIGRLWFYFGPDANSVADNFVVVALMFIAVLGYGWLGYRMIELPVLKFSHQLRHRWFDHQRPVRH
jgi:peptidoglycan/LPS O-acetylase OafA/YrhL